MEGKRQQSALLIFSRWEMSNEEVKYGVVARIGWNGLGGGENSDAFFLERVGLVENEPLIREEPPLLGIFR